MARALPILAAGLLLCGGVALLLGAPDSPAADPSAAAAAGGSSPDGGQAAVLEPVRAPELVVPAGEAEPTPPEPGAARRAVAPAVPVVRAVPVEDAAGSEAVGASLRVEVGSAKSPAVNLRRCWWAGKELRTGQPIAATRRTARRGGTDHEFLFDRLEPGDHVVDLAGGSFWWTTVEAGPNHLRIDDSRPFRAVLEFVEPLTGEPVVPDSVHAAFVHGLPPEGPDVAGLGTLAQHGPRWGPAGPWLRVRGHVPVGVVEIRCHRQAPVRARIDLSAGERIRVEVPRPVVLRLDPPASGPRPGPEWAARLRLVVDGRRLSPRIERFIRPYRLELHFEPVAAAAGAWSLELDDGSRPPFTVPRVPLAPGSPIALGG